MRQQLRWIRDQPDLARFLLLARDASVIVGTRQPVEAQNRRFNEAAAEWATPRIAAREVRDLPTELLLALWIGPTREFGRAWLAEPTGPAMDTAVAALPAAAWRALRR